MGAGDDIVPRVQLHEAFKIVHNKTQHIESEMAVNGTSRAMQGSDCMRLRARDDRSWSADGEPETANSYFTAHRLEAQKRPCSRFYSVGSIGMLLYAKRA